MADFILLDVFLFLVFVSVIVGLIYFLFYDKKPLRTPKKLAEEIPESGICTKHHWGKWYQSSGKMYQWRNCTKCNYIEEEKI